MSRHPQHPPLPAGQPIADRVFATLERFLHVEAVSGVVLLIVAAAAMLWANSAAGPSYAALWHTPVALGFGDLVFSEPLEFWVNDGLMTIFFLVVGLEIRREMHEGALADRSAATRLSPTYAGRAQYCVDASLPLSRIIHQLLAHYETRQFGDDLEASVLVATTLRRFHPC